MNINIYPIIIITIIIIIRHLPASTLLTSA
jgi:hypothetical protein